MDYTIAEEYVLPSKGKVYAKEINPVVKLRSMTTQDEMKRLAPSELQYKNICEVIDDCILTDVGISSYDMCIADYQFLLTRLRIVTYGTDYKTVSTCPYCGFTNEITHDLSQIEVQECDMDEIGKYLEFELPVCKKKIRIGLATPRSLDDIQKRNNELKKKSKGKAMDATFLYTMMSIIVSVDGEQMGVVEKEKFVNNLAMMDTNYIMKHAQKLVESFGVSTDVVNRCHLCGLDYNSSFRITKEFFGPSIDI